MQFNLRSLLRACFAVATLSCWFVVTMRKATPNTSWEHHPYAGPFILLKEWGSISELLFAVAVSLAIFIPALLWVRDGASWAFVVAGIAALASVALSYACAISASV